MVGLGFGGPRSEGVEKVKVILEFLSFYVNCRR